MNNHNRFNPKKLEKLNNPERYKDVPPEYVWKRLALINPSVLIDVGAGTGFYTVPFIEFMGSGKAYSCDVSEEMVQWQKENLSPRYPQIYPLIGPAEKIPLEDGIADLVVMINLHHELDEPVSALEEAFRLLKKGGKVAVIDWKKGETPKGPPQEIRVSPEDIRSQIEAAGFGSVIIDSGLSCHSFVIGTVL